MGNQLTRIHPGSAAQLYPPSPSAIRTGLCFTDRSKGDQSLNIQPLTTRSPTHCELRKRNWRLSPELYVYCSYRNWELARKQIELERGLDYVSTNRRFSVLHVAVENNAPLDIILALLEKGLHANLAETLFDQTPLHVLTKCLEDSNSFHILDLLLSRGADVNAVAKVSCLGDGVPAANQLTKLPTQYGRTPLYFGIKHRIPLRGLAKLLKAGAKINPEVLIYAREKSRKPVGMLLEQVIMMTILCLPRTQAMNEYHQPESYKRIAAGDDQTNKRQLLLNSKDERKTSPLIVMLPIELLRELRVMLFG